MRHIHFAVRQEIKQRLQVIANKTDLLLRQANRVALIIVRNKYKVSDKRCQNFHAVTLVGYHQRDLWGCFEKPFIIGENVNADILKLFVLICKR